MVKELFKKALDKMLADDEFDKIAAYTTIKTDKKLITTYKETLKKYGAENLPIIPLIQNANADILRDAICYMIDIELTDAK